MTAPPPGDGAGAVERARALLAAGDAAGALDLVEREAAALEAEPAAGVGVAGVLLELGLPGPALGLLEEARRRLPFHPAVEAAVGHALVDLGRADEAADLLRRCLARVPGHPGTRFALALALADRGDHAAAEALYAALVEEDPGHLPARINRAEQLCHLGRAAEAREAYDRAVAAAPDDPRLRLHRAALLLSQGDPEGWADWERRLDPRAPGFVRRGHGLPRWDGSPVGRLLVDAEQGLGEQILFSGFLDRLRGRVGEAVVECHPRLRSLFARSFPWARVEPFRRADDGPTLRFRHDWLGSVGPVDAHVECGSLPALLGHRFGAPAPAAPRLVADPALTAALRRRYDPDGGRILVGISWRSGRSRNARHKSVPLAMWGRVLDARPDVRFVSLQYEPDAAEVAAAGGRVLVDPEVDPMGDADPCAAQAAAMDLVVTVSCTAAHLAGALGVRTLVLTPSGPGLIWYWGAAGEASPFYGSVVHLRQEADGGWEAALGEAAAEVARTALRGGRPAW